GRIGQSYGRSDGAWPEGRMTALHFSGPHAMMVDSTMDFQACVLIASRSPDRQRGDCPNDCHRRDIDNKNHLILSGMDNVINPENKLTMTAIGAVAKFQQ